MKHRPGILLVSFALAGLALVLARCGSDGNTAAGDAGNAMAAMTSASQGSSRAIQAAIRAMAEKARGRFEFPSCPPAPSDVAGFDCDLSCSRGFTKLTSTCNIPESASFTCKGTTYKMTGTFKNTQDYSGVANDFKSGTLTMTAEMTGTVEGGTFTGKTLACTINFAVDVATIAEGQVFTPDCSNFTCTYDGVAISCDDLKSSFGGACT